MKPAEPATTLRSLTNRRKRRPSEQSRSGEVTPRKRSYKEVGDKRPAPDIDLPNGLEMKDVLRLFGSFLGVLNGDEQAKHGKRTRAENKRRKNARNDSARAKKDSNSKRIKRDTGAGRNIGKKASRTAELEVIDERVRDEADREEPEPTDNHRKLSGKGTNTDLRAKKSAKPKDSNGADQLESKETYCQWKGVSGFGSKSPRSGGWKTSFDTPHFRPRMERNAWNSYTEHWKFSILNLRRDVVKKLISFEIKILYVFISI